MKPEDSFEQIRDKYKLMIGKLLGTNDFSLVESTNKCSYMEKLPVGRWKLTYTSRIGGLIASFELHPMINCCGICVSTQAYVVQQERGKGLGTLLNQFRIDIARHNGYSLLLCTDIVSNSPQRSILKANGWRDIHSFVNRRTGNTVAVSVITL